MATPVNFPDSPINGEIFTNPNNGFTYQYVSSVGWTQYTAAITQPPFSGTPTGIFVGSEPVNPIPGIVWFPTGPGTFGIGYIWNGSEWAIINAGRVDSGLIAERPSGPTIGDLFFNTGTQIMELWDGISWIGVPTTVDAANVTFASGTGLTSSDVKAAIDEVDAKVNNLGTSLVYGGTYDASTNLVGSVTTGGTTAGLVVGSPLPSSASNTFVIVTVDGTGTSPAPTTALVAGNWLVNNGTSWDILQFGDPVTSANLVTFSPTTGVGSANVQAAIEELDTEKANKSVNIQAGTGLTGGGDLSANSTISLDNTSVSSGSYGGQNKVVQITVDPQGRLTAAAQIDPQVATTFQSGVVQLEDSTTSTSQVNAPTSNALKTTKDVADSALSQANINDGDIGSLPNLNTGNKSDLVSAINEVDAVANAALPKAGGTMSGTITATDVDVQTGFSLKFANGANGQMSGISDLTTSVSPTTAASSLAAKTAYDKAVSAESDAATANSKIGTLANLQTTDKTNTVSAINELDSRIDVLSSSLIYGGTYDASTNTVSSATQAGTDAGLVVGQALATGAATANVYVIISVAGTGTSPAPTTSLDIGDWLVGNGTSWDLLQLGTPSTTASLVSFVPSGSVSATTVQAAIEELDLEKIGTIDVNLTESNVLFVDAATGNDGTAVVGDITKPYATISAALTASVSPNNICVSEGTYAESNPLNVPAGVSVCSRSGTLGYTNTFVTPNDSASDLFVLQGNGSAISGITVETPITANKAAIRYTNGASSTASVTYVGIRGTASGAGDGIVVSSSTTGKIISYEIRYQGLNMGDMMKVEGGILATESVHVPNTVLGGGPVNVFSNKPSLGSPVCRLQCIGSNSGNSNVTSVAEIAGGTSVFYGVNWFNSLNGVQITANDYDVEVSSGLIDCTTSVLVDPSLTGANGRLVISAFMNNSFSYPNTWSNSNFVFEFLTKIEDENAPSQAKIIRGADLTLGTTTKPQAATFGRGPIHKQGMVVLTSDNTASSIADGGNITNVTTAARSKDLSTFTFQGTGTNHCIYFGTDELDSSSFYTKHYGLDLEVMTGDSKDGKYVFEYWDGSAWVEIGSQSVSSSEGYSYSSDHFWRSGNKEKIFYGLRPETPIVTKTIGGFIAYWVRARVFSAPTTLPQFVQCFLIPQASLSINNEGIITKLGGAQTATVMVQGSNVFSENGNVTNYIFTMGNGSNAYSHNINNVLLNQVGEGLYWQTAITQGVCTALPIYIEVGYSLNTTTTTAPQFDVYFHRIRTSGSLVADIGGALIPVRRPESQTTPFTGVNAENPELLANFPLPYLEQDKLHRVRFGPFSVTDFYEGDALALQILVADKGAPAANVAVWGVAVIGYTWTDGIRGF